MSFADLKKNAKSNFEKLAGELAKTAKKGGYSNPLEEKIWNPKSVVDKAGNGYAVIRFLPEPKGEDLPFVKVWHHGFQGPGGWYIENSLSTLGQPDPVGEYNSQLWNSTTDDKSPAREQARKQKRKTSYYSNIYIVKDPVNPENEGKVFLFKYGQQIFNIINSATHPEFEDEQAINPFCMWTGANFKLKIRTGEYGPNYEKSEFDSPSALSEDDAELEAIYNQLHPLKEFLDPKNFKSYDELKTKLNRVLGFTSSSSRTESIPAQDAPAQKSVEAPKAPTKEFVADDDDDLDDYFKSLGDDD